MGMRKSRRIGGDRKRRRKKENWIQEEKKGEGAEKRKKWLTDRLGKDGKGDT